MSENSSITYNGYTFEIVTSIPIDYEIWPQEGAAPQGYLPLCKVILGSRVADTKSLKAIETEHAEDLLTVAALGYKTLASMQEFINKNKNAAPGSWVEFRLQTIRDAYSVMRKLAKDQLKQAQQVRLEEEKSNALIPRNLLNAIRVLKHTRPFHQSLKKQNISVSEWENAVFTAVTALGKLLNESGTRPIDFNREKANALIGQPMCVRFLIDGAPFKEAPVSRWVIVENIDYTRKLVTVSHIGELPMNDYGQTWELYRTYVSNC